MFSGIIETMGYIETPLPAAGGRLVIGGVSFGADLTLGESVSINGACMTVVDAGRDWFSVDVSRETLQITRIGRFLRGEQVNLERGMRLSDRLGGHLVLGHVDCLGRIDYRSTEGNTVFFKVIVPAPHHRYLIPKGSLALEGIILTVNALEDLLPSSGTAPAFGTGAVVDLAIIPHTILVTTLSHRNAGDLVHLELDMVGKYVERFRQIDGVWQGASP